ncbi:transcription-repair coupling factor [Tistlia consotensis]|uniref:Transcription-repair-coupling factor n=1 Tax=Tistlia consotensis USBA 355 TaxID=560819 RepID=A0A1Y6CKA7_9PROT|nr:transcription-repair coupling factor [Tistlia consotensis]SMF70626.1 transcription-repair coupling factor [Tistlia consotensis USBA 355]SNS04271.1 transcription-repair coupling factor [Tistlia consotensis]
MLTELLELSGRSRIANAPEGLDALLLAEAARARPGKAILHVARDDARTARLAEALAFYQPSVEVLTFPAWDCLPYDRVGPHRDLVARRLSTLIELLRRPPGRGGRIVVATVNALLQRVPPRAALRDRGFSAAPGDQLATEKLVEFLGRNGYERVDTVGEPGEYALRGGIVDLFPTGAEQPLRLDFFGDELETIRTFDPLTQISTGTAGRLDLLPASEVLLDADSIQRFRSGYREAFGAVRGEDPLYQAVSEGRPHPGMEHWLPLFHERLETLLDYLPGAAVTLDHQAEEVRDARLETIDDFYEARRSIAGAAAQGGAVYRPLPPQRLYLTAGEWDDRLADRASAVFEPFAVVGENALDAKVVEGGGRHGRDFADARTAEKLWPEVEGYLSAERRAGRRALVAGYSSGSRERLRHLLQEHGIGPLAVAESWAEVGQAPAEAVVLVTFAEEHGFGNRAFSLVTETDILGERIVRPAARRRRAENFLTEVSTLGEGDYVVHVDHGIGRYEGLETIDVGGAPHDCLKVSYHGNDRLFVPVENIEVLSRFGSSDAEVELDRLGQTSWQARKARVKERLKEAADELIRIAAARELKEIEASRPPEGLYEEFAARFPYPETDDQLRAIDEVLGDLDSGRPMDRLICGDVGFGKTEVALRAAFVAAMNGHQVAIVVPTTLLARQHYATFAQRFAGLPVRVAQLSRLVTAREAAQIKAELAEGKLDIIVGTHALLAESVKFKDLGLLIVDEEQHFGVKQKERLKALRADVHVLTLTATPIPRTLQLALSGVRELSLIATPPVDRLAVRTFVLPYDPVVVREAIMREHFRGGQIFYVAPRLEDLAGLQERLGALVPEIKIAVAHGKLSATQLEDVMSAFVDRRFDLLLSTNIVESGLDIPSANTLIIHRADLFGLAQLYQLRGRIGRSKQRGYAYFTLRPGKVLTAAAEKRLHVMQTLDTLGAGFSLASHDLDIRGAGNLLGEEQSGHVREVGIELYQQLLEEAVANARAQAEAGGSAAAPGDGRPAEELWAPQINLGTSVLIPEGYVRDLNVRLSLYRRLATLVDRQEIEAFAAELIDRFGPLPDEVENLLEVMAIKRLCRDAGIEKLDAGPKGAVVTFRGGDFANPGGLIAFLQRQQGRVVLRPDHKLVYKRGWDGAKAKLQGARRLLEELAKVARQGQKAA